MEEQDALFTGWNYSQEYDAESGKIRVRITAAPKTLTEGMKVNFIARSGVLKVMAAAGDDGYERINGYSLDYSSYGDWLTP